MRTCENARAGGVRRRAPLRFFPSDGTVKQTTHFRRFYYYNTDTGECTWDKPENYVMVGDNELMKAALLIQTAYRARKARRLIEAKKVRTPTASFGRPRFLLSRPGGRPSRCCLDQSLAG